MHLRSQPAFSIGNTARILSVAAVVIWAGLLLLAGEFADSRLWGLNHLAFLPGAMRWVMVAAAAIAVLSVVFVWPPPLGSRSIGAVFTKWPGLILVSAIAMIAGWALRSRAALLGDGFMRAADSFTLPSPMPSEFLPSGAAMALVRYAPAGWSIDGQDALRLVSIGAAVLLAVGLWYFAPRAGLKHPWAFVFWILTFGSTRLLAGYVETYALPFAFVVLWALTMTGYLRGRLPAWWAIMFALLAILSHYAALTIAPATAWALWRAARARGQRLTACAVYAALVVLVGGFLAWEINRQMVTGLGVEAGHFLLPLLAEPPMHYGVFTPAHWIDFLNHWLLLAPGLIVAGLLTIALRWDRHESTDGKFPTESLKDAEGQFWLLAIILPVAASLLLDPKLGWARDWDLFAVFYAPALVAAAIWLSGLAQAAVRRAASAVAVLSLGLWLAFAVDAGAEQRRFEALLTLDVARAPYGYEILALSQREQGQILGEIRYYEKSLALADNNRIRANIANAYCKLERWPEAMHWYESVLARDSLDANATYGASLVWHRLGRLDDALPLARRAAAVIPEDAERQFSLASILFELRRAQEALAHFEEAARLVPSDPRYWNMLGGCHLQVEHPAEALAAWRQAMRADPGFLSPYLNASRMELSLGNFAEARRLLDEYERRVGSGQRHVEARFIADSLARVGS